MIEISVDMTRCQHYGQCVLEAPAVFELEADDSLLYRGQVGDDELDAVESARDVCPMQAISITRAVSDAGSAS